MGDRSESVYLRISDWNVILRELKPRLKHRLECIEEIKRLRGTDPNGPRDAQKLARIIKYIEL